MAPGLTGVSGRASPRIAVSTRVDFQALAAKWRELETRANPSFFQSWTWMGCLAAERFPNPVLVEATRDGQTVALALFNRRGETLHLGASGLASLDTIYVEFNGVLAVTGQEAELTLACLRAARGHGLLARRLVLNGIDGGTLAATEALGGARDVRAQVSPYIELCDRKRAFLDRLGANTRYQLRRSERHYAGYGEIVFHRAGTRVDALERLDDLAIPHQKAWIARGHPGAFANPFFRRFHRALIEEGFPRGEIDLSRVSAGEHPIGYLYNFRYRGRVLSYQSGFNYDNLHPHARPGLTCHHLAITHAAETGMDRYDFLAGGGRYKLNLSDKTENLYWAEIESRYAPRPIARRLRAMAARWWDPTAAP